MGYSFTHKDWDKMAAISQTTFSDAFSRMKMYEFDLFVPKVRINNIPALVQIIMAWRQPGDKPLSEPMMVSFLMHICITGLRIKDTIWIHICSELEEFGVHL